MDWFLANTGLVADLMVQHARLSVLPVVLGLVLALPPGVLAWRHRAARGPVLAAVGLLYTIPSLALFVLLPPIIGISFLSELNVVIAMTVYAVALMTRFVTDALDAVDPAVRAAATAVGYSAWGRFWAVELPLAGPVLLAGLRVVAVSTVSLVTVGVLVGTRSLGFLFMDGLQRGITAQIVTGILATVVVALVFDVALVLLGRLLMPWTGVRGGRAVRRLQLTAGGAG
ncbi:ABC transporter permease [Georgenia sp. H159]|uniref:ABC transporter permease n=1 Tax=Georgenia sp. H159 TaxID=3076115 RepID=UPI002D78E5CA|nr:ABC transporter permease [Georgenia sp. H159]